MRQADVDVTRFAVKEHKRRLRLLFLHGTDNLQLRWADLQCFGDGFFTEKAHQGGCCMVNGLALRLCKSFIPHGRVSPGCMCGWRDFVCAGFHRKMRPHIRRQVSADGVDVVARILNQDRECMLLIDSPGSKRCCGCRLQIRYLKFWVRKDRRAAYFRDEFKGDFLGSPEHPKR